MCGAIIRDLYSPEVQGEEVTNRVSEVIEKNLEMVQKIGFLLGEGASETEQMLNSIIESYKTKKALKESEELARREKEIAQNTSDMMNNMLEKLPTGVVIVDNWLKILHSNQSFINIIGEDAKAISDVIPGLAGADIKTLIPFNVYNMFTFVIKEDEPVVSKDVHFEDKMLNISIFPIKKNQMCGAIIRDLYSPEVQGEEVTNRVSEVIEKNLEMVQKIGFLLGEGASETEQMLNSIIESYKTKKETLKNNLK